MKVNKNTNVTKRGYTQCPLPAKQLKIKNQLANLIQGTTKGWIKKEL